MATRYQVEKLVIERTPYTGPDTELLTVAEAVKLLHFSNPSAIGQLIQRRVLTRVVDTAEPNPTRQTRLLKSEVMEQVKERRRSDDSRVARAR